MTEALTQLWRTAADIAPKLALFVLLLAAGTITAKIVRSAITNVLMRARFDNLLNKAGLNNKSFSTDGSALGGLLAYYAVLLITLQLAFGVFGDNPISHLLTSVIAFLPRLLVAIALIVVAALIANAARTVIANTLGELNYTKIIATIAHAAIVALGVIAALGQIGVATTVTLPVLIAALGAVTGILIVGVGGGLIKPMQQRWESYLSAAEAEAATLTQTDPVDEPELELDDDDALDIDEAEVAEELDEAGEPNTRTTITIRRTEL